MKKYICIHGHFYQPPRENPWIGEIERQASAYPYHDWNERIDAECYTPNTAARILDPQQYIVDVLNNYQYISFNFGPTLLQWIEKYSPKTYSKIVEADTLSVHRNNGHGNAIAQVYNHIIMPLANRRDKEIQVMWGIEDFKYHFHRDPEGMWLAETAVDIETLEILADCGIKFTILAPYQARRFRLIGSKKWIDVGKVGIDTRFPYLCKLPGGKSIILFFYDGGIAQEVAFGGLINSGEAFFNRLFSAAMSPVNFKDVSALLVNVATDGETYGHHHKFAEMGLAYALKLAIESDEIDIINYAGFLDICPPVGEVEIWENTSWSCVHGIERWRSDCGCKIGAGGGNWSQQWRAPLREAMNFLRDRVNEIFYEEMRVFCERPDEVLNDYVKVLLSAKRRLDWVVDWFGELEAEEIEKVLKLLEMKKFSLFAFTSCGWFFDEISGIESVQVLTYAARCVELLKEFGREDVEIRMKEMLSKAKSNIAEFQDGSWIYENMAKARRKGPQDIAAHFCISNLFCPIDESVLWLYGYRIENYELYRDSFGDYQISVGRIYMLHSFTQKKFLFDYAVLYTGAHDVRASLKATADDVRLDLFVERIENVFKEHNLTEIIRQMDTYFGPNYFSMDSVMIERRQQILDGIVQETLQQFEDTFESLFEAYQPFFRGLRKLGYGLPFGFMVVIQQVLNRRLKELFSQEKMDEDTFAKVSDVLDEIERFGVSVEVGGVKKRIDNMIYSLVEVLEKELEKREVISELLRVLDVVSRMKIQADLWSLQNLVVDYSKKWKEKILPDEMVLWKDLAEKVRVRIEYAR